MKILIAPDKFRGTFTAREVCVRLARGIAQVAPSFEVEPLPLADGGEGTLDVVLGALGGRRVPVEAVGPLGDRLEGALIGLTDGGTAVIESAMFCGLSLVAADRRDPLRASTEGVGMAIAAALDLGARRFLIGLGGTATVDGGLGMARGLGFRFDEPEEGALVSSIRGESAHPALAESGFTCLCDVSAPLLGPRGAAAVFGPQKGAAPMDITVLELRLSALAAALRTWRGRDVATQPGAGSGGGLGAGAAGFLDAALEPGAAALMRLVGFPQRLIRCDVVVTGEGAFDAQSLTGKAAGEVLAAATAAGKHAILVTGRCREIPEEKNRAPRLILDSDALRGDDGPLEGEDLEEAGRRIARWAAGAWEGGHAG